MKALTYNPVTDDFVVQVLPVPTPGAGDVLVKVHACGLNSVDSKINFWHGVAPDMNSQWAPGLDVSGEIIALGENVEGWKVGDKVLYHGNMFRPHGGYAEYAVQKATTMVAHPELPVEQAAATPCAGWTAWRALVDKLRIQEHDAIFIAGGAGGVGSYAIQIARNFGVKTIITTSSAKNHEFLRSLGATHLIDYREEDVFSRVMEITENQGVPVALDAVGGDNDILTASILGYEGQMVELVRTLRPESYKDAFDKGLSFHQLSLGSGHRHGVAGQQNLAKAGRDFTALVESGKITTPILETITLEQTGDALKSIRQQRTVGKIVLKL